MVSGWTQRRSGWKTGPSRKTASALASRLLSGSLRGKHTVRRGFLIRFLGQEILPVRAIVNDLGCLPIYSPFHTARCSVLFRWKSTTLTFRFTGFVFLLSCILLTGCRSLSAPERLFAQFQQAVEAENKTKVWSMLSKASQRSWNQYAASQTSHKNGKQLFLSGELWKPMRLRRDPKRRPKIAKEQAVLFFRNELEQPVRVAMVREAQGWRVALTVPTVPIPRRVTPRSSQ